MRQVLLIFLVCFIVVSLFVGLYHLVRGSSKEKGGEKSVVKSLTVRLIASVVLLSVVLVTAYFASG